MRLVETVTDILYTGLTLRRMHSHKELSHAY